MTRTVLMLAILAGSLIIVNSATTATDDSPPSTAGESEPHFRALVYTRTLGFRHQSIPHGVAALRELAAEHNFVIEPTEDPRVFDAEHLKHYDVIVFLNTTGNILSTPQREAFEKFIREGGGFVGIHSAADTGYDWEFYGKTVGAYFRSHPHIQEAKVIVEDRTHVSTQHLPAEWVRTDEWYNFRTNPREEEGVHVLMRLNTSSFEGSTMPDDHPIAWCRTIDKGRAWYTAGGHTNESFAEPKFRRHLLGGLFWAADKESLLADQVDSDSDDSN